MWPCTSLHGTMTSKRKHSTSSDQSRKTSIPVQSSTSTNESEQHRAKFKELERQVWWSNRIEVSGEPKIDTTFLTWLFCFCSLHFSEDDLTHLPQKIMQDPKLVSETQTALAETIAEESILPLSNMVSKNLGLAKNTMSTSYSNVSNESEGGGRLGNMSLARKLYRNAAEEGWRAPYQSQNDLLMLQAFDDSNRRGPHLNNCAVIQSSGYGKSRTLDEIAKSVFSIPFNVRNARESTSGMAYPAPDTNISALLMSITQELHVHAHLFFASVFHCIKEAFQELCIEKTDAGVAEWREHLSENKEAIYNGIRDKFKFELLQNIDLDSARTIATAALKTLLEIIPFRTSSANIPNPIQLLISIDEAHTLSKLPKDKAGENIFDALLSAFADYSEFDVFLISLSTNSRMDLLAPPAAEVWSGDLIPPFTESSFDLVDDVVKRNKTNAEEIASFSFMAQFGRPLYAAFLRTLEAVSDKKKEQLLINLLQYKLLGQEKSSSITLDSEWPVARRFALLDLPLYINYSPTKPSTREVHIDMVASHMRTAFSVAKDHFTLMSGYPSEPLLATAAVQLIDEIQEQHLRESQQEVDVLASLMNHSSVVGSIDLGQRGENVVKILLLRAYMAASKRSGDRFCEAVYLVDFLEELFSKDYAELVLSSFPVNLAGEVSLKEKFANARVRFNQFIKSGDDTGMTTSNAWLAFIRGVAVIGWDGQKDVDVMIPILLHDCKISEWVMSGLLIQIKRRSTPGSMLDYAIHEKEISFFPPSSIDRNRLSKTELEGFDDQTQQMLNDSHLRPYISLVMEVGITGESSQPVTRRIVQRLDQKIVTGDATANLNSRAGPSQSPVKAETVASPARRSASRSDSHPRYSIFAYGCSSQIYKVIFPRYDSVYRDLLQLGDVVADHPRLSTRPVIRAMKPAWVHGKDSYGWAEEPFLNGQAENNLGSSFEGVFTGGDTIDGADMDIAAMDL